MASEPYEPRPPGEPAPEGTRPGFERLVEAHYQAAYRFAFSLSGNHDDACDLTQQAFYIAQTKGHQLRDPTKGKQWLFTVLHREFLAGRRHVTAHPQTTMELAEAELPHISVDLTAALDAQSALAALHSLDEIFRAPLALFYLEQLSYKEIAAALEIPIGTVMSRLARGKQVLRVRLEMRRVEGGHKIVPLRQSASATGGRSDG